MELYLKIIITILVTVFVFCIIYVVYLSINKIHHESELKIISSSEAKAKIYQDEIKKKNDAFLANAEKEAAEMRAQFKAKLSADKKASDEREAKSAAFLEAAAKATDLKVRNEMKMEKEKEEKKVLADKKLLNDTAMIAKRSYISSISAYLASIIAYKKALNDFHPHLDVLQGYVNTVIRNRETFNFNINNAKDAANTYKNQKSTLSNDSIKQLHDTMENASAAAKSLVPILESGIKLVSTTQDSLTILYKTVTDAETNMHLHADTTTNSGKDYASKVTADVAADVDTNNNMNGMLSQISNLVPEVQQLNSIISTKFSTLSTSIPNMNTDKAITEIDAINSVISDIFNILKKSGVVDAIKDVFCKLNPHLC
jgi:hypothetical protein